MGTYPQQYSLLCFSDDDVPKRSARCFPRFNEIFDLDIEGAVTALVMSLQGDDEIDGGASRMLIDGQGSSSASEDGDEGEEWEGGEPESQDYMPIPMMTVNSNSGLRMDWELLKR